jgi:beta-lactamase regulating signal transducer with metallopeptidase domain
MSEPLAFVVRLNLALAAAVLVVLALRLPLRRLCGAQAAYGLWALVPLTAAAMLPPARVLILHVPQAAVAPALDLAFVSAPVPTASAGFEAAPLLVLIWALGAAASLALVIRRQWQFARAVKAGRAGPAVVGVFRPRIVVPADFETRYSPREQRLVLAHEQTHVARQDSRTGAAVAIARCLAWFNPFVHLFAYYLRVDQELACDARVVAEHPSARRAYAEAMLKAQLAARPLPLGCYWPATAAHPLARRVALLRRETPSRLRRRLGLLAVAVLGVSCAASAWASRPPRLVTLSSPAAIPSRAPVATAPPAPSVSRASDKTRLAAASAAAPRAAATTELTEPAEPPEPPEAASSTPPPSEPPVEAGYRPRVIGAANRSSVEPGNAVRVVASYTDPNGETLVTDLTSFGSQSAYRSGYIGKPKGNPYSLFTSVTQQGERLVVTASLGSRFAPSSSGSITLASGETGRITLPGGEVITVTATVRPETAQEIEDGLRAGERQAELRLRYRFVAHEPFQCGRQGAVC